MGVYKVQLFTVMQKGEQLRVVMVVRSWCKPAERPTMPRVNGGKP